MRNAKFAVLLALLSCLAYGSAIAQQAPSTTTGKEQAERKPHTKAKPKQKPQARDQAEDTPQAQEEQAAQPEPEPKAGEKAPPRPPPQRRRSVQQSVQGVTPIPQAGGTSYGPALTPSPSPALAPGEPPPAQINNCVGGHCTDASGATYNSGVGNAGVDSQGRLCNRVGNTMQCF